LDTLDLAEIAHPDYPGERLVACRNPPWPPNARNRTALIEATEPLLAAIAAAVSAGRLFDPAVIGIRVGKVIGRYRVGEHVTSISPWAGSPTPVTRLASTPKVLSMVSTSSVPTSPPSSSHQPTWSPLACNCPVWNVI
jgi:hypothetical protein